MYNSVLSDNTVYNPHFHDLWLICFVPLSINQYPWSWKRRISKIKNVESAKKDTIYTRIKEVQKFKKFNKQRYNQSLFIHDDSQAILNEIQTKTAEWI